MCVSTIKEAMNLKARKKYMGGVGGKKENGQSDIMTF